MVLYTRVPTNGPHSLLFSAFLIIIVHRSMAWVDSCLNGQELVISNASSTSVEQRGSSSTKTPIFMEARVPPYYSLPLVVFFPPVPVIIAEPLAPYFCTDHIVFAPTILLLLRRRRHLLLLRRPYALCSTRPFRFFLCASSLRI